MKKKTEKAVAAPATLAIIPENYNVQSMSPAEMGQAMVVEAERRKLIMQYISFHMKEGVDYGKMHITANCAHKYDLVNCKNPGHWSKANLFKPGSEKFVSLFKLRPVFRKDTETIEMFGVSGIIAYICELRTMDDVVIGEGRGAAKATEKESWTPNHAIKIAQKRAQIDAVLRTGALSDFFTQDLEDSPIDDVVDNLPEAPKPAETASAQKAKAEKLYGEAKAMIAEQPDPQILKDWRQKIVESPIYSQTQKNVLVKLIDEKTNTKAA